AASARRGVVARARRDREEEQGRSRLHRSTLHPDAALPRRAIDIGHDSGSHEAMKKTALITGASGGIGAELAWLFAADGHDVVLVARRRDKLDALAGEIKAKHSVSAHVIVDDLGSPGAAERIVKELGSRGIEIEFLVNNAGFGSTGAFAESELARVLEMV